MKTYQDYLKLKDKSDMRMEFVSQLIAEYKRSELYENAVTAQAYFEKKNVTIREYKKLIYDMTGKAQVDNFSANFRLGSSFFRTFILQEVQYLLSNGASFDKEADKDRLGKTFDAKLKEGVKNACIQAVSYIFWNFDHIEVFKATEFAPLYDEEDGALKAGVRFWQIAYNKPLRATLYDLDGLTSYIWNDSNGKNRILYENRAYIRNIKSSKADGDVIYNFENYPTFPIIPLWANEEKQSELEGLREGIDCYDLIKSGFANDLDDASLIYWTIKNAGGMDDIDLRDFLQKMKKLHAAQLMGDQEAEAHTVDVPFESRDALLNRIRNDLYRDAMALDVEQISAGNITATQIKASYEPLDEKCNELEYCILNFLEKLTEFVGIPDATISFTRSAISNVAENIQSVIQAAPYTGQEYTTRKLLEILGDGDKADDILKQFDAEQINQFNAVTAEETDNILVEE